MNADQPVDVAKAVLDELRGRVGIGEAITAPEMAFHLNVPEREVRRVIATHSGDWAKVGLVVIGAPGAGFYVASKDEEIRRRRCLLVSLELQAKTKRQDFEALMRAAGFGGLIEKGAEA